MGRYSFRDDYSEGCHPQILAALSATNMAQQDAYGNDEHSAEARSLVRQQLDDADMPVFFVAGGTLGNIIIAASALRSHEAVISAASGHIATRETGAIEATGHKVIIASSEDGKLTPHSIETALAGNAHYPHMSRPRMVYLSNATETGTVYTKAELTAISGVCKTHNLHLLLDGARLGVALASEANDLSLAEIARLTDIFWIGGTKAGALIGEAIVIPNRSLAEDFAFHIKQRGALLAKGRLLGLQFAELFRDDLFFTSSRHANAMAQKLSMAMVGNGHALAAETQSNQVFPVLPAPVVEKLQEQFDFYVWEKKDSGQSVIRLVTSWATDEVQVNKFINAVSISAQDYF